MIHLKTKKRLITSGKNKGKHAYIAIRKEPPAMLSNQEIEERIMKESSLSIGDVRAAISSLAGCIAEAIDRGDSIDLGDIGTLYTQVSTPYRFDPKDISTKDVSLKLKIKPKKKVKQVLQNVTFRIDHTKE